jgi:hypothetical protein
MNAQAYKAVISTDETVRFEYKITILGSDITVGTTRKLEDPVKSTSERSRKIIEPYIFELVSDLKQNEMRVLAHDTKFMLLLDEMNHKFESGYKQLMQLRKES